MVCGGRDTNDSLNTCETLPFDDGNASWQILEAQLPQAVVGGCLFVFGEEVRRASDFPRRILYSSVAPLWRWREEFQSLLRVQIGLLETIAITSNWPSRTRLRSYQWSGFALWRFPFVNGMRQAECKNNHANRSL